MAERHISALPHQSERRAIKHVVIVADHRFTTDAIGIALRHTSGLRLVEAFDGRHPMPRALEHLRADVVVIDDMQRADLALARVAETAAVLPHAKVVLICDTKDQGRVAAALKAGAHAIISKAVHRVSLGTVLREIVDGNVIQPNVSALRPAASGPASSLTDRELEILQFVAEGWTNSRIGKHLWVTEQTVKFHLSNIYRKLGVRNRTEASRHAHIHGLVDGRTAPSRPQAA